MEAQEGAAQNEEDGYSVLSFCCLIVLYKLIYAFYTK